MKYTGAIILLLTFALVFNPNPVKAQDEDYKEILFMIIDGDLEKAVSKTEKYMNRSKTKRDPVPYIYSSMAYYEISKRDEMAEDYPRAYRDAIKNAYKARRYDRENEYFPNHMDYINELKGSVMKEARFHFESENWRKSTTYAKYVLRIDPGDLSALLLKGVAEVRGRNSYQAERTFEEAEEALKEFSVDDVSIHGKDGYLYAVAEYADLMKEEGKKQQAEPYVNAIAGLFDEDPEYEALKNSF